MSQSLEGDKNGLLHDDDLLAEGAFKRFAEVASEHPAATKRMTS